MYKEEGKESAVSADTQQDKEVQESIDRNAPREVILQDPVSNFTKIKLRPPKAKHVRDLKFNGDGACSVGDVLMVAGKVSGMPRAIMDELSWRDVQTVIGVMSDFLGDGEGEQ